MKHFRQVYIHTLLVAVVIGDQDSRIIPWRVMSNLGELCERKNGVAVILFYSQV